MKSNIFKKKDKTIKPKEGVDNSVEVADEKREEGAESTGQAGSSAFSNAGGSDTHKVLKGFYVSEKASLGNAYDQYMFRVFKGANKSEVKKEVSRLFNVKVKSVRIVNLPKKRRDFGKHPGFKSGFKKAVVTLQEGYVIGQAKP